MKNKILASVLAVCLFVGLAVPAFAISSQSGTDTDIKTMEFSEKTYTVKNTKTEKMASKLSALVSGKQAVQEPSVVWSVQNDDKYAFNIDTDTGLLSCVENAGTATVTASINVNGKEVKATTKVVAAPSPKTVKATGFQFEDNRINALTGLATAALLDDAGTATKQNQEFNIVAYPKDAEFTADQISAIVGAFNAQAANFAVAANGVSVSPSARPAGDKVIVDYANGTVVSAFRTYAGITMSKGEIEVDGVKATFKTDVDTTLANLVEAYNVPDKKTGAPTSKKDFILVYTAANDTLTITQKLGVTKAVPEVTVTDSSTTFTSTGSTDAVAPSGTLSAITSNVTAKVAQLEVAFPRYDDKDKTSNIKRSVTITGTLAKTVESLNAAGSITLEVGEKVPAKKYFVQGPSSANVKFTLSTPIEDYIDQNAQYPDYAAVTGGDDFEIMGVAVGVNKITSSITLPNGTTREASLIVNVIEKGKKPVDPEKKVALGFEKATLKVGEARVLPIKNAAADASLKFTTSDAKIATVDATGKITAVAAGTATITAVVGEETLKATVTVSAPAPVVVPEKPTTNPSTGVALLGQLF